MARRASSEMAMPLPSPASGRSLYRYVLGTIFAALTVMFVMFIASRVEQYLISDSRFILPAAPESGAANPNFKMDGLFYTAEQQVTQVFARDFGRSVYLCPIAERRLCRSPSRGAAHNSASSTLTECCSIPNALPT
jgi:hypothetical protein